jgi:hypothetical protein
MQAHAWQLAGGHFGHMGIKQQIGGQRGVLARQGHCEALSAVVG